MVRYSPTSAIPVAEEENHISTSYKEIFRGADLNDLYEEKKASLLSYSKVENNGSGWVLDRIIKLIVKIADYRPLSNVNFETQAPLNINDDDRAGGCSFDIGNYLRNKKAIIVPQNKKDDPFCLLWATTIAKFKPEGHKGRITEILREQSKSFNIEGINFPASKNDAIKFFKRNNLRVH